MKYSSLVLFTTIVVVLFLFPGCDDSVKPGKNQPPVIESITSMPATSPTNRLPGGDTVRISVVATDPDKDELSHTWLADEGRFIGEVNEASVQWEAPNRETEVDYVIEVIVSDGALTASGDITIYVDRKVRTGSVKDIDGNEYKTVKIGDQWWMAENLRTTRYRNGDAIPTNLTNIQWQDTPFGAYAIYPHGNVDGINSEAEMVAAYGKLYNWNAVVDSRGLCPPGWHVPTDAEWTELVNYVEAQGYPDQWNDPNGAGNALKSRRQVNSPLGEPWATSEHPRWNSYDTMHGLDVFGFSALPGGHRGYYGGGYGYFGVGGFWWSSTEAYTYRAWYRLLYYVNGSVSRNYKVKRYGSSVRCLRD